jgi:hypothetical protein
MTGTNSWRRVGLVRLVELCRRRPVHPRRDTAANTNRNKARTSAGADGTSDPRADATLADIHLPAARAQPRPSLGAPQTTARRATYPVLHPETSPTPLHVARTQAFCATRSPSEHRPRRRSASCSREAWCARDSSAPTVQHDGSAAALATVRSWNSMCGSSDRPPLKKSAHNLPPKREFATIVSKKTSRLNSRDAEAVTPSTTPLLILARSSKQGGRGRSRTPSPPNPLPRFPNTEMQRATVRGLRAAKWLP